MALEIGIDPCGTLNATDYKEPQVVCFQQNTRDEVRYMNGDGAIAGALAAESGMKQTNYICYENHAQDSRVRELKGVSSQISAKAGTGGCNLPLVQECFVKTARPTFKGGAEKYADTGVAPTLNTFDQGDKRANELVCEAIAFEPGVAKREGGESRFSEELCGTLRSNMGDNQTAVAAYSTVRRLLPIECERLMGFPDNWTRIPWKGKLEEECPDSPRYKACGNSMCVNVMQWIGEQIERVEKSK